MPLGQKKIFFYRKRNFHVKYTESCQIYEQFMKCLSGGKEALSQHRAGLPLPIRRRRGQGLSRSADVNTRGRPSGPPFLRRSGGHAPPEQGGGVGGGCLPRPSSRRGLCPSPRLCTQEVRVVGGHGGLSVVSLPGPAEATLEPRGYL